MPRAQDSPGGVQGRCRQAHRTFTLPDMEPGTGRCNSPIGLAPMMCRWLQPVAWARRTWPPTRRGSPAQVVTALLLADRRYQYRTVRRRFRKNQVRCHPGHSRRSQVVCARSPAQQLLACSAVAPLGFIGRSADDRSRTGGGPVRRTTHAEQTPLGGIGAEDPAGTRGRHHRFLLPTCAPA